MGLAISTMRASIERRRSCSDGVQPGCMYFGFRFEVVENRRAFVNGVFSHAARLMVNARLVGAQAGWVISSERALTPTIMCEL